MSHRAASSSGGTIQFAFVSGDIQSEARSHAMRQHWMRRRKHNQAKSNLRSKASRNLLPRSTNGDTSLANANKSQWWQHDVVGNREKATSVPAQILYGVSYALSSSRPDPFQTCPVRLTSQHQKLLHHCAYEIFCQFPSMDIF